MRARMHIGSVLLLLTGGVLTAVSPLRADPTVNAAGLNLFAITSSPFSGFDSSYYYSAMTFDPTGNYLIMAINSTITDTSSSQGIYSVPVTRGSNGYITGFGAPTLYATVATSTVSETNGGNAVGGGLVQSGTSLMFTTWSIPNLGVYSGGSTSLYFNSYLSSQNLALGGLQYVPSSFTSNGAGLLKMSTSNGAWFSVPSNFSVLNPDSGVSVPADSFAYAPADPYAVAQNSILVEDDVGFNLKLYGVNSQGDPTGTGVTWLSGNDSAFNSGIVRDPNSREFIFSTNDGTIWALQEETPEPGTLVTFLASLLAIYILRRRAAPPAAGRRR